MRDLKNYTNGRWGPGVMLYIQKNEKITRTAPVLKYEWVLFPLIFFSMIDIKNFTDHGGDQGALSVL